MLKSLRERSQKRKKLLAQTVRHQSVPFKYIFGNSLNLILLQIYFTHTRTHKQLGVQNVEDLKHVLGTTEDSASKPSNDESKKANSNSRKSQSENLFYRDSSTFLKVYKGDLCDAAKWKI